MADATLASEDVFACFDEEADTGFTIRYDPALSPQQLASALAHELCHAALHISGQSNHLTEASEEAVVRAIEYIYIPALKTLGKYVGHLLDNAEEDSE